MNLTVMHIINDRANIIYDIIRHTDRFELMGIYGKLNLYADFWDHMMKYGVLLLISSTLSNYTDQRKLEHHSTPD